MLRISKRLAALLIGLSSVTVSCGSVAVFNKEVCADLGVAGAHCAFTLSNPPKRRDIPKPQWDKDRIGWMCMRAEDFSDAEDSIDSLCRSSNMCDYKTKERISQFKKNTASVVTKAKQSRKK